MLKRKVQEPEEMIESGSLFWRRKTRYNIEFKTLFDIAKECGVQIVDFTFYDGEAAPENYYDQHYVTFAIKGTAITLRKFWNCVCGNEFFDFFQI